MPVSSCADQEEVDFPGNPEMTATVRIALDRVRRVAQDGSNLMPPIIEAAKAYATEQEVCDVLREVMGVHRDPAEF